MAFWNDPTGITVKQKHRWILKIGDKTNPALPLFLAKTVQKPSYEIEHLQIKYLYGNQVNIPKRVSWNPITIEFYDALVSKITIVPESAPAETKTAKYDNGNIDQIIFSVKKESLGSPGGGRNPAAGDYKLSTSGYFSALLSKAGYSGAGTTDIGNLSYTFKDNLILALTNDKNQNYLNPGNVTGDNIISIYELNEFGEAIETWTLKNPLIKSVSFSDLDYSSDEISTVTVQIAYDWAETELLKQNDNLSANFTASVPPDDSKNRNKFDEIYKKFKDTGGAEVTFTPPQDTVDKANEGWKKKYLEIITGSF